MDFEKGLIAAILREGYEEFLKYDFDINILEESSKEIIIKIKDHWEQYKKIPSMGVMEEIANTSFGSVPIEPIGFWIFHCKKQYLRKRSLLAFKAMESLVVENKTEEFYDGCGELSILHKQLSHRVNDEAYFSTTRYDSFINDIWNGVETVKTPWQELDERLQGGYKKGELTAFVARPGVGKTNILLLSGVKAWQQGKKVLLVSTEMTSIAMEIRGIFFSGIFDKLGNLRRGMIDQYAHKWIQDQLAELPNKGNFILVSDGFDTYLESIESKIVSFNPDLVIIDGVYLLKTKDKEADKYRRVADIFDKLKALAKNYDVPVAVSSQLNRSGNKGGKVEKLTLERVAFSDNAGMVADNIIGIDQDDDMKKAKKMELIPLKLREGNSYNSVMVNWDFDNNNFTQTKDSGNPTFGLSAPTGIWK